MAFGLGFKKTKVLGAAEKLVAQGKIPAAIEEYRKILGRDPKDLTLLNTVADLCVRAGKTDEAVTRFYELAEKCVEAGLVPRAIATYKRITKIAPDSIQAVLRLGDLYSMQGLLRDARVHYSRVVDFYARREEKEKERDVFEKVLTLDMENPKLHVRMAELYTDTGKTAEGIVTYLGAAERYLDKNQSAEATDVLQTVLRLDPQNIEASTLLGRAQFEERKFDKAAETLEAIPSLASQKGALTLLFQAYVALGNEGKAKEIAADLFERYGDFSPLSQVAESLVSSGELEEALEIYQGVAQKLVSARASASLIRLLENILASHPNHIGTLELIVKIHRMVGHLGDARESMELLARAYIDQGEWEKARELCSELVAIEPDNLEHLQLLNEVEAHLGDGVARADVVAERAAAMVAELSPPAPKEAPKEEVLDRREAELVTTCITEAELYITYHQTSRAIEALENGLSQVPGNTRLLEQLLALHEKSQQYTKAAECCEALTEAYAKLGDGERASHYGELVLSYRQKAQAKGEVVESSDAANSPVEAGAVQSATLDAQSLDGGSELAASIPAADTPQETQAEPQVREVDLSMEWASVTGSETTGANADENTVEEIEFYIQAGLTSDALAALERLQERSPAHPAIAGFRERLGIVQDSDEAAAPQAAEPDQSESAPAPAVSAEEPTAAGIGDPDVESEPALAEPPAPIESPALMASEIPETSPAFALESETAPADAEAPAEPAAIVESPAPAASEIPETSPAFALESETAPADAEAPAEPAAIVESPAPAASEIPEASPAFALESETAPADAEAPAEPVAALAAEQPERGFDEPLPSIESVPAPAFELRLEEAGGPPQTISSPATPHNRFGELTGDLEEALTIDAPETPAPPQAAAAAAVGGNGTASSGMAANPLGDVFAEFKAQMEQAPVSGDMETHYNMGVAFKEMALYDEAIGEFQKVYQLAGDANDSSHTVQCCSLLATCFLEKGLPQLAVKWYRTALDSPGLDPEGALALLYEMGAAYEIAGDQEAALRSFLEVYARNIDYRDVASRIHSLQQSG